MKVLPISLLLTSMGAAAGSGPSTIHCKSGTGRTQVSVASSDFYIKAKQLRFTIDGKSLDIADGLIVWGYRKKVVTVVAESDASFQLYGLPKTFAGGYGDYGAVHMTFKAIVQGTDPRPGKRYSPKIEVFCKLDYEI